MYERLMCLLTNTTCTAFFGAMGAAAAVFTGGAVPGTFAGFMVFVVCVRVAGEGSTKGSNGHQGGNSKRSFHNEGFELRG
jgi:hypothetical protein